MKPLKNIYKKFSSFFVLLNADIKLRRAIKKAEMLHDRDKKRYYVIPNLKHDLIVVNWAQIKQMRKNKIFSNRAKQPDFIHESFYYTGDSYGTGKLSAKSKKNKRKAWLNYVAQVRRLSQFAHALYILVILLILCFFAKSK